MTGAVAAEVSFDVDVVDPDGAGVYGLAQVMVNASTLATLDAQDALDQTSADLAPAGFANLEDILYIGYGVDAAAGGTVEIALPPADELPAAASTQVTSAFPTVTHTADCAVQASGPANTSIAFFEMLVAPGLVANTANGGFAVALLSDAQIDVEAVPDGTRLYSWMHSDAEVDVAFAGTGCETAGLSANLSLEAGWNTVAYVTSDGGASLSLENAEIPETVVATVVATP